MSSNTIADDLLTFEELAAELNVTPRTIQRWHARRKGPPRIRMGGRIYFRAGAVRAWILEQEQAEPRSPVPSRQELEADLASQRRKK